MKRHDDPKLAIHRHCLAGAGARPAQADPIFPSTYDIPNGNGVASDGSFNYWDFNYSGSGAMTTIDNAPLSGGLGDLSDGITATDNWLNVESVAGTGPYVGWRTGPNSSPFEAQNPTVTFRFAGTVDLDSIVIHVNDSGGAGGVSIPASVAIDLEGFGYTNFVLVAPDPSYAPVSFTFSGLGLTGAAFDVRFNHGNEWLFGSEVTLMAFPSRSPYPSRPPAFWSFRALPHASTGEGGALGVTSQ